MPDHRSMINQRPEAAIGAHGSWRSSPCPRHITGFAAANLSATALTSKVRGRTVGCKMALRGEGAQPVRTPAAGLFALRGSGRSLHRGVSRGLHGAAEREGGSAGVISLSISRLEEDLKEGETAARLGGRCQGALTAGRPREGGVCVFLAFLYTRPAKVRHGPLKNCLADELPEEPPEEAKLARGTQ